ncbi:MAG: serine protease Do [Betaproteobacteria bacterium]|jgi:S1-C subfamily serine protease|nr:serine protease Do [Betaproteobacteria bacterium]
MLQRLAILLALLAAGCSEAPDIDLKLVTIESPSAVGLSLRELPPSVLKSVGLSYGLAVVRADGMAEKAGLRMGDVVYGVNQQRLRSIDDFRRLVSQPGESTATRLLVRRGKSDFYVAMELGGLPAPRLPEGGRPAPNSRDTLLRT